MILNQTTVTKSELQNKVSIVVGLLAPNEPKPHGGPSNRESLVQYKQRLFGWLLSATGDAPTTGTWEYTVYNWCLNRSVVVSIDHEGYIAKKANDTCRL